MADIVKPSYPGVQFLHKANGRVHAYHRKTRTPIRVPFGTPEFRAEVDALNREVDALNRATGLYPLRSTTKKTKIAVEWRRGGSAAGVYLLIRDNRVVYIGTSEDMASRVVAHRSNGRQFDRAYYIHAPGKDRFALERLLIAAIRPEQNTRGTFLALSPRLLDLFGVNGSVTSLNLGPE